MEISPTKFIPNSRVKKKSNVVQYKDGLKFYTQTQLAPWVSLKKTFFFFPEGSWS
jgi:hypothetical protein